MEVLQKQIENGFDVCLSFQKASDTVVIAGETEESVEGARAEILDRLRKQIKLNVTVEARKAQLERVLGGDLTRMLQQLKRQHGDNRDVTIYQSPSQNSKKNVVVHIKGVAAAVQSIKRILENAAEGRLTRVTRLLNDDHATSLLANSELHFEKIRRDCSVQLEVKKASGHESPCVVICGEHACVTKAEMALYGLFRFSFPGNYLRVKLPETLMQQMQRSRYQKLNNLQDVHGVQIQRIHQNELFIQGESVAECEAEISQMVQDHHSLTSIMTVDRSFIGTIIGDKGSTIKRIIEDAGGNSVVRINIDRDTSKVSIVGQTKQAAATAKKAIQEILEAEKAKNLSFHVPVHACGDIIGRKGATINEIQSESGCRINLRRESGICQISGPNSESVQSAKDKIDAILEKVRRSEQERETQAALRETRETRPYTPNGPYIVIEVPAHLQAAVIGRRGETVLKLQKECGCRINVRRDSGKCFIVDGSEQGREMAKVRFSFCITCCLPFFVELCWCILQALLCAALQTRIEEIMTKEIAQLAIDRDQIDTENGDEDGNVVGDVDTGHRNFVFGLGKLTSNNSGRAKRRKNKRARSRKVIFCFELVTTFVFVNSFF